MVPKESFKELGEAKDWFYYVGEGAAKKAHERAEQRGDVLAREDYRVALENALHYYNFADAKQKARDSAAGLLSVRFPGGSGHGLDRRGKPALMSGRLVLVNDVLVRDAIDGARGVLEHGPSGSLVASVDCFPHVLDGRAQFGAQARIVLTACFALSCALSG